MLLPSLVRAARLIIVQHSALLIFDMFQILANFSVRLHQTYALLRSLTDSSDRQPQLRSAGFGASCVPTLLPSPSPTTCLKIHAVLVSRFMVSLRRAANSATLPSCQSRSSMINFRVPTIVEGVDDMGQPLAHAYDRPVELEEFSHECVQGGGSRVVLTRGH